MYKTEEQKNFSHFFFRNQIQKTKHTQISCGGWIFLSSYIRNYLATLTYNTPNQQDFFFVFYCWRCCCISSLSLFLYNHFYFLCFLSISFFLHTYKELFSVSHKKRSFSELWSIFFSSWECLDADVPVPICENTNWYFCKSWINYFVLREIFWHLKNWKYRSEKPLTTRKIRFLFKGRMIKSWLYFARNKNLLQNIFLVMYFICFFKGNKKLLARKNFSILKLIFMLEKMLLIYFLLWCFL